MLEVAVRETDKPPGQSEDEPAEHEGEYEVEQVPAPFDVDERREYVGHVALTTFLDVGSRYVTFAVLEDESLVMPPDAGRVVTAASLLYHRHHHHHHHISSITSTAVHDVLIPV